MRDPRYEKLAQVLVGYSVEIKKDDPTATEALIRIASLRASEHQKID